MPMVNGIKGGGGLVENQYAMELDFKVFFSLLILVVLKLYLMNPTDGTLVLLSCLNY